MVKLKHKGLLVLGITKAELHALMEGKPMDIPLADLGEKLKGQKVMLIPGPDNDFLKRTMESIANAYENGATSPIQIAKAIPKIGRLQ